MGLVTKERPLYLATRIVLKKRGNETYALGATVIFGSTMEDWRERFEMYFLAANITDAKQKKALLLYVAGPVVSKIFNTLTYTGTDYNKTTVEKLDSYFQSQKNAVIY